MRRLVIYEDYALRLLQDIGVRTARPHGVIEITPEREYVLVTEFFKDAEEISEAHIGDGVIDQGLALIRNLWDAGIAHRDIKPGNLMVRSGELLLIDVAFVQVRPSPWRQAVDLGNMMLVLACRSDPQRVYRRALAYFTPDELAEAFAATRGVASPTQLRAFMKRDPRDLLGAFRALAPQRPPIVLQRWSIRRIALAAGVHAVTIAALYIGVQTVVPVGNLGAAAPSCGTGHSMILSAQAVPSAAIAALHGGAPAGLDHRRRRTSPAGRSACGWTPTARTAGHHRHPDRGLRTSGAQQISSDQPGMGRFEHPLSLAPRFADRRFYTFPGGCVTYGSASRQAHPPSWADAAGSVLSFQPRSALVGFARRSEGLALCGRGAACMG